MEESGKEEGKGEPEGEMVCSLPRQSRWWRRRGESVVGWAYLYAG
jgi:hypothetical protein